MEHVKVGCADACGSASRLVSGHVFKTSAGVPGLPPNDPQHAADAYVAATGGKRRGSLMWRVLRSGVAHAVAHPEEALSVVMLGAITGLAIARVMA